MFEFFYKRGVLKQHNEYCQNNGVVKVTLPKKGQFWNSIILSDQLKSQS